MISRYRKAGAAMTSRNFTVAIFASLLLAIPAQAAAPSSGTATVKPPLECAAAKTATECADILKRLGENPFDAFDYPDSMYAIQNETPLPPCRNRAASCNPWERDWSNTRLPSGSIVTDQGVILPQQRTPIVNFLYNWQTIITGGLAILAALIGGGITYRAGVIQANATRTAADSQVAAVNTQLAHLKAEKAEADKREEIERQQREISNINLAISGIKYNIETLLHIVIQFIIPHHADAHKAVTDLHNALKGDPREVAHFAATFFPATYPALVTLCPDVHFIEWDFFDKLPFLAEKDPELLGQTHWLISQSRDLVAAIKTQNSSTQESFRNTIQEGGLTLAALNSILNIQTSVANGECLTSLQLFELFLSVEKKLEAINDTYKLPAKKSKLTIVEPFQAVMNQLHEIKSTMIPASGVASPPS
jgi:hypothetical protein